MRQVLCYTHCIRWGHGGSKQRNWDENLGSLVPELETHGVQFENPRFGEFDLIVGWILIWRSIKSIGQLWGFWVTKGLNGVIHRSAAFDITWVLVTNASTQLTPQNYRILTRSFRSFVCTLKFEKHWLRPCSISNFDTLWNHFELKIKFLVTLGNIASWFLVNWLIVMVVGKVILGEVESALNECVWQQHIGTQYVPLLRGHCKISFEYSFKMIAF